MGEKDGYKAYSASMARVKEGKTGCVNFFTKTCLGGDPQFEICDNIKDSQLIDFSEFPKVQSVLPGLGVHRVTFFTQPNYEGMGIAIEGREALFNIGMNWRLGNLMKKGKIRSIKVHKF